MRQELWGFEELKLERLPFPKVPGEPLQGQMGSNSGLGRCPNMVPPVLTALNQNP